LFLIGFLIWGIRSWKTSQVEQPEFRLLSFTEMGAED
jgi:hypothetical protein